MARSPPVSTRLDTAHAALTRTARVVSFRQRISAGVAIAANVVVWGKRTRGQGGTAGRTKDTSVVNPCSQETGHTQHPTYLPCLECGKGTEDAACGRSHSCRVVFARSSEHTQPAVLLVVLNNPAHTPCA